MSQLPPDLAHLTILIVEDEFYLAIEMQDAIERAGGTVVGPCADYDAAVQALARVRPDYALIDINLGTGPSFAMADTLHAAAIPFAFLTGYDASAIPDRFAGVHRLQKPTNLSSLLQALAAI